MLRRWRIAFILVAVMALGVFISACGGSGTTTGGGSTPTTAPAGNTTGGVNCVSGTLKIDGSSALEPLVSAVANDYQSKCSGAKITVTPNGSGTGLKDADAGSVDIGMSDVFPKVASQKQDLVDHQVAVVIFTMIVNSKVTGVTSLTSDQIKGIYTGTITNWKQVNGPDLPIVVVERPAGSGTRATFDKYVLNGGKETITSKLQTDVTGTVITNVKSNDGAIGYVALGPAKADSGVTVIGIDSKMPGPDTVNDQSYKFWNLEHMYTKGEAAGMAKAFIDYMSSDAAKQFATQLGYVRLTDVPDSVKGPRATPPSS